MIHFPIPLFDEDAGERALFLKLFLRILLPGFLILAAGEYKMLDAGLVGPGMFAVLLVLNLPAILVLSVVLHGLMDRSASVMV